MQPGMFLVDGHNVWGLARERLVDALERLGRAYGVHSVVVFDGTPVIRVPDSALRHCVKVFYARPGQTVDDHVVELLRERRQASMCVVTSDQVLARRVRRRGVRVAPASLLRRALTHITAPRRPLEGEERGSREREPWAAPPGASTRREETQRTRSAAPTTRSQTLRRREEA